MALNKLKLIKLKFLLKKRKSVSTLVKRGNSVISEKINTLINRLETIDREISITYQEIFKANLVKIRLMLGIDRNILIDLQKKFVAAKANNSVNWHQDKLLTLRQHRREVQFELDKLTNKVWHRRVIKLIRTTSLFLMFLIAIGIVILGIFTTFYLLPIFALLICTLTIFKKLRI